MISFNLTEISFFENISLLSLQLHFNMLVYDKNIFGTSSVVFGNLREMLGNVRQAFENFWKIFGKSSKISSLVCSSNKQNNTWWRVEFIQNRISLLPRQVQLHISLIRCAHCTLDKSS